MANIHVFDELRRGLKLRKYGHGQKVDDGAPLFFPKSKGWRNLAPPKTLPAWTNGPLQILEALIVGTANRDGWQYSPGVSACSETTEAHLQLLRTVILSEGGMLPSALAIAAEHGRDELEPADLADAARRATSEAIVKELGKYVHLLVSQGDATWPSSTTVGGPAHSLNQSIATAAIVEKRLASVGAAMGEVLIEDRASDDK
uniref:Uncharacterized protein n=1 Tax=Haptolina brevifila TaxID=156173 RepID=A0A6U7EV65_9EUKA|mmetsp:Transcript_37149/g.74230  ORF Transcript_37149/g.74230 Transcript_37149/m.74230 type:complete len:202 (+) Transcript_37149:83-688(+)